jgi:cytosine deaminase
MAYDLIIRSARVADGIRDIAIADGRIAALALGLAPGEAAEVVDAQSRFVSPGLVEAHFHLDKALILDRCAPPKDRRTRDHMQRTAAIKHTFTVEDIYARARAVLEDCLLNGVTHMRTQVEVDPNVGLRGWEAVAQLARDYAWAIDLQPCVFLQEGWTNVPGAEANVVAALEQGARVVGGAPRYDTDRPRRALRRAPVFGRRRPDVTGRRRRSSGSSRSPANTTRTSTSTSTADTWTKEIGGTTSTSGRSAT